MQRNVITFLWAVLVAVLIGLPAAAFVADSFSMQGTLTDDQGNPVADGTYTVEFSIWDAETGGTQRWSETQTVTTVGGNFSVYVGDVNPIDEDVFGYEGIDGEPTYLQIKIEVDPPMTRMLIGGSPFAFTSSRVNGLVFRTDDDEVVVGREGQDALIVIAQPAPATTAIKMETGATPTTVVDITGDANGGQVRLIGNSPLQPIVDIGALPGGGHLRLIGSSPLEPFVDVTADAGGGHLRLIGQSPLQPGIELDATDLGAGIRIGTDTEDYFRAATDTDGFCLDVLVPGIPLPQWGLCANYSQGTVNMNVADLAILRAGPEGPHFTMNDTGGGEWFKVEEGESVVIDPSTLQRSAMHAGGFNALNTSGEQWFKVEKGESVISDPATQAKVSVSYDGIDGINTGGELYWKVEEGEEVIFDPSTLAKTVMAPAGLSVYNSSGVLSAVFEPNGVSAPSANFGSSNAKTGINTFVAGQLNTVNGNYSTIGGGNGNIASGGSATVAGGTGNDALFSGAFVGGGNGNTASGMNSTVPGGTDNSASGAHAFAAGKDASAVHTGAFAWSDASGFGVTTDINNQFKIRATGGTIILSDTTPTAGVRLSKGSSVWQTLSDRNAKRNIRQVDADQILALVQQLNIHRWSYKTQSPDIEHMGPMAQDFYALFGLGEDERHLTSLDLAGIALASIQALNETLGELEVRTADLERARADAAMLSATVSSLASRMQRLESLLSDQALKHARVEASAR